MAERKKIIFITNPISGTLKKSGIPGLIEKRLDMDYFDPTIVFTEYKGHAADIAEKA